MTPSTTELDLNLRLPNLCVIAHAVQGDALARVITANLYDGSTPWTPPEGAIGVIKFSTALGTSGMYDTDEDGNTAVTWSGNVATLRIVQNAIAVPGDVPMQLKFYDGNEALSTFRWECLVEPSTMTDTEFLQTDYYNILSQQIAAILEVQANIPTPSTSNPAMDGTAAPGTSTTYSRGDHVHPTDTSRAPTNHAKNDTTYGAASTSNYGHVRLSNTTPSMDGTAAVGSSTDVARANHVHPSDTSRVPTTREINGLDLSEDRTLTAENIGYDGTLESHTAGSVGKELGDLNGAITSEASTRANADTALQNALSDEATARANTDAVLEDGLAIVMPTKQATQNLIYGDYVFVTADNKLYRMTNDCNQGNYIVVNTNCTVANTIAMPIRRYADLTINIGESTPLTRITNSAAMILITFFRGGRVNFIAGQYAALRGNTIGTILNFGGANDTLTVKGDGTGLVITSSLSITSVLANIIEFVY